MLWGLGLDTGSCYRERSGLIGGTAYPTPKYNTTRPLGPPVVSGRGLHPDTVSKRV